MIAASKAMAQGLSMTAALQQPRVGRKGGKLFLKTSA